MKKLISVSCFLFATLISGFAVAQTKLSSAKNSSTSKVITSKNYGLSNLLSLDGVKKEKQEKVIIESEDAMVRKEEASTLKSGETDVKNIETIPATKIETSTQKTRENIQSASVAEKSVEDEKTKEVLGEEYSGKLPKYIALIIGISKYMNEGPGLPSLDFPVQDAGKLRQVLINRYAFESTNIYFLENPSRSKIIDMFELLSNEVKERDNLLIFYAGHGFYDKEKNFGYWLPADARANGKSEWISNTTIRDYLGAINAKHTLLISDACFGGSIFKSRGVMENMMQKVNEIYKYPSRRAMTSGNLSIVPDKSFFTEYLIKRLNDNVDAFLPSQTLFYRIYEPVTNNSPATPQFGVVQGTGDEGGDFIFIKKRK
jgi:hypothetical protein